MGFIHSISMSPLKVLYVVTVIVSPRKPTFDAFSISQQAEESLDMKHCTFFYLVDKEVLEQWKGGKLYHVQFTTLRAWEGEKLKVGSFNATDYDSQFVFSFTLVLTRMGWGKEQ